MKHGGMAGENVLAVSRAAGTAENEHGLFTELKYIPITAARRDVHQPKSPQGSCESQP